jgi:hypothetical protein
MPHVRSIICLNWFPVGLNKKTGRSRPFCGTTGWRTPVRVPFSGLSFAVRWLRDLYKRHHDIQMSHVSREWLMEHAITSGRHTGS